MPNYQEDPVFPEKPPSPLQPLDYSNYDPCDREYFQSSRLHWAAQTNNLGWVQQLLWSSRDYKKENFLAFVNGLDKWRQTPLHYAVKVCNPAMVDMLIKAGADVHVKDQINHTPLCNLGDNLSEYHNPANYTIIVKLLLDAGADIEGAVALGEHNPSPLIVACQSRNQPAIDALLAVGANPNTANPGGWTPLHEAVIRTDLDSIQKLVGRGANANHANKYGLTPIDFLYSRNMHMNENRRKEFDQALRAGSTRPGLA